MVRVAVQDDDPCLPVLPQDWVDHPEGPGLALVALLADRWAAEPDDRGGKVVWFEVGGRDRVAGC